MCYQLIIDFFSDELFCNFRNLLQYTNWQAILNNDDANESNELFQSTLLSLFDDHCPLQTKHIYYNKADQKPWITPGIFTSIRENNVLKKTA